MSTYYRPELASLQVEIAHPLDNARVTDWRYEYAKRALDFCGACVLLVIFLLPGLLIATLIALNSAGPVFYREERIGRYGQKFKIWKFRSMRVNAGHHVEQHTSNGAKVVSVQYRMRKHEEDPRITGIGKLLRRWSIDEVPQLLNVLRGEMSLVGPRPIVEAEMPFFSSKISYYLAVTPGMSGLWQISGRSNVDYPKRAELDATYVKQWSLLGDITILLHTLPAVLSRRGAR